MDKEIINNFILSSNVQNNHICIACKQNVDGKCQKNTLPKINFKKDKSYETCAFYTTKKNR